MPDLAATATASATPAARVEREHRAKHVNSEEQALVQYVGDLGTVADDNDGFIAGPNAVTGLRGLESLLRNDKSTTEPLHILLGQWRIAQSHLIPLLVSYRHDRTIFLYVLKLLVRLTLPISASHERYAERVDTQIPLREYFCKTDSDAFSVIMTHCVPASITPIQERTEEHVNLIELSLHLFKNLLLIPTAKTTLTVFDELILLYEHHGILDMFILLARNEDDRLFSLLVLDCIASVYLHDTTESLVDDAILESCLKNKDTKLAQSQEDTRQRKRKRSKKSSRLHETFMHDRVILAQNLKSAPSRHSRFGTRVTLTNDLFEGRSRTLGNIFNGQDSLPSNNALLAREKQQLPVLTLANIQSAQPISGLSGGGNSRQYSSMEVPKILTLFMKKLVDSYALNTLLTITLDDLTRGNSTIEIDNRNWLTLASFGISIYRAFALRQMKSEKESRRVQLEEQFKNWKENVQQSGEIIDKAAETQKRSELENELPGPEKLPSCGPLQTVFSLSAVTYLFQSLRTSMHDKPRPYALLCSQLHFYMHFIRFLYELQEHGEMHTRAAIRSLRLHVFSESEHIDILIELLRAYAPGKCYGSYLPDLVIGIHYQLRVLSDLRSEGQLIILTKKKITSATAKPVEDDGIIDEVIEAQIEPSSDSTKMHQETEDDQKYNSAADISEGKTSDIVSIVGMSDESSSHIQSTIIVAEQTIVIEQATVTEEIIVAEQTTEVEQRSIVATNSSMPEKIANMPVEEQTGASAEGTVGDFDEPELSKSLIEEKTVDEQELTSESFQQKPKHPLDEDAIEEEYPRARVEFNYSTHVSRYCHPQLVHAYARVLTQYRTNPPALNAAILRMFERIAFERKLMPMFWQLSLLQLFDCILDDELIHHRHQFAPLRHFCKKVVRSLLDAAARRPLIFAEVLFWKSMHNAEFIANDYVNIYREAEKQRYRKQVNAFQSPTNSTTANEEDFAALFDKHIGATSQDNNAVKSRRQDDSDEEREFIKDDHDEPGKARGNDDDGGKNNDDEWAELLQQKLNASIHGDVVNNADAEVEDDIEPGANVDHSMKDDDGDGDADTIPHNSRNRKRKQILSEDEDAELGMDDIIEEAPVGGEDNDSAAVENSASDELEMEEQSSKESSPTQQLEHPHAEEELGNTSPGQPENTEQPAVQDAVQAAESDEKESVSEEIVANDIQ